jgi:hypothetical protein
MKLEIWVFFTALSTNSSFIQIGQELRVFYVKSYVNLQSYLSHFLWWEIFQTRVVEKIRTHISCSIPSSRNCSVYEIMWKNTSEPDRPQITIRRMRITCAITQAYMHTLRLCNTYRFSTATVVTQTRLITLYINCLSCLFCGLPTMFSYRSVNIVWAECVQHGWKWAGLNWLWIGPGDGFLSPRC